MASFRQKSGSWEYIVSAGKNPVTGKYDKITKSGFRTKTEARNEARRIEEELKQGTYVRESKMTFGDFVEQWFSYYEKRVKESTVYTRRTACNRLLKAWEHYPLNDITMSMYQQYMDKSSEEVSKSYLSGLHATASMIFAYAAKLGLIRNNPTKHFEMPRMVSDNVEGEEELGSFFDTYELEKFFKVVKADGLKHDMLIFTTLAYSGLRVGELVVLKESDIDFRSNEISVSKTYVSMHRTKADYLIQSPKTKGSIRKIELDPFVISLIKEHLKTQKEEKMKHRMVYKDNGFLFADEEGYPLQPVKIRKRLRRLIKRMDTDKHITTHSFRHTNISLLIEAGVPIGEIQRRSGHSDIQTTMNIYTHMTKDTKDHAANLLNVHLSGLTNSLREMT